MDKSIIMIYENNLLNTFFYTIIFIIGFIISLLLFSTNEIEKNTFNGEGKFINLVFIGSQNCPVSNNDEELIFQINEIKDLLNEKAKQNDLELFSTGVSTSVNVAESYSYLNEIGNFDQIIVGLGWNNIGIEKYIWDKFQGLPVTPQLLITKIDYEILEGTETGFIENNEIVLKRLSGKDEIHRFYEKFSHKNISLF
ncbi:MAG: hypothetical protein GVY08_15075 [Bacteroidetes bacterium]|jgi:hypothetical protein|nr:hypothetical protein [Bacteroidota bacterium]